MNKKDRQRSAISVSRQYQKAGLEDYGDRVRGCASQLGFSLKTDPLAGEESLDLSTANFCRVRHCPICQWRRSLMWTAKAHKILPLIVRNYSRHKWIFLTLTRRNSPLSNLREDLVFMNQAWQRLTQRKEFPAIGWVKTTEVTRDSFGLAHPHFHCLLLVPSSYASGSKYIKKSRWVTLWQEAMRSDCELIIDVQTVKDSNRSMGAFPWPVKYCTKTADLIEDTGWLMELASQVRHLRWIAAGGVVKEYLREEEINEQV